MTAKPYFSSSTKLPALSQHDQAPCMLLMAVRQCSSATIPDHNQDERVIRLFYSSWKGQEALRDSVTVRHQAALL